MKRVILAAGLLVAVATLAISGIAAPPHAAGDAPVVPSLGALWQKELHWGMAHQEVTDAYNNPDGVFDREYAPQMGKLQPGVKMQELEADKENRKVNFARSFTQFGETPTGYDVTPLHDEYTYHNEEAVQRVYMDGKNRYFFFIRDRLWKIYDEVPLKADGPLGTTFQDAVKKLNNLF